MGKKEGKKGREEVGRIGEGAEEWRGIEEGSGEKRNGVRKEVREGESEKEIERDRKRRLWRKKKVTWPCKFSFKLKKDMFWKIIFPMGGGGGNHVYFHEWKLRK